MSKVALYRKYRPETFDEVIGQDIIIKVLANQISKGSVSHAYLFTGSRGTGKTSCAKIFAKAINCLHPNNGSPCGKCDVCVALKTPTNLDIVEMDAASNNGVDDIRSLREVIGYMPAYGKYKVYIIDEVHMLSSSAFNALLKTLEEPPAHVVFVLCTTEAHKLPATILSRCMRFDFGLVPTALLADHVKKIFAAEKITADDQAIYHIAKLGEGSVRDTLSIADRCANAFDKLTYADVLNVTGVSRTEESAALIEAVINSNVKGILSRVEEMSDNGKNISLIARDLMRYARDLMAVISGAVDIVSEPADIITEMKRIAELTDNAFLVKLVMSLSSIDSELRYSVSPKIVLESALLSLCTLASKQPITPPQVEAPAPAVKAEEEIPAAPPQNMTADEQLYADVNDAEQAVELLGFVLKGLRTDTEFLRLYGEWATVSTENIRFIGNTFVVYVENRLHLLFNDSKNLQKVQDILSAKGYNVKIALATEKNAPDKIAEILRAAGDAAVLVDKKGRKLN